MNIFLHIERLKTLSDSVLLVGIVLLVYNLASLAATKLYDFDSETFLNTLVAYITSFIAVFTYWSVFSTILSCIKQLNEIMLLLSISILILVTRSISRLYQNQAAWTARAYIRNKLQQAKHKKLASGVACDDNDKDDQPSHKHTVF